MKLFTLAILSSYTVVLFFADWTKAIERWTSPLFLRLFLPLILSSFLIIAYLDWLNWALSWIQLSILLTLYWGSTHVYSFYGQIPLVSALIASFIAYIPTIIFKLTEKPYRKFRPPYLSSIYTLIVLCALLVIPYE